MAKYRKHILPNIKEELVKEAGMKCANPGCSNYRTHIHHIKEWAVYGTHDEKHMIAICPTCHDAVHHGELKIDDDTLYNWKKTSRNQSNRDQLFIEPGEKSKLLLGTIAVTGNSGISVFEFSPNNKLSFKLVDGDIFLINMSVTSSNGKELFKVTENHVKYDIKPPLEFKRRPGKVCITAPGVLTEYMPIWAVPQIVKVEPQFFNNGRFKIIDIEILKPGLVKVEGFWLNGLSAVCITKNHLSFLQYGQKQPLSLCGSGEDSLLVYDGPIGTSLFKLGI